MIDCRMFFTLPVAMSVIFNIVKFRTASVSFNLNITADFVTAKSDRLVKTVVLYVKQVAACAVHKHFFVHNNSHCRILCDCQTKSYRAASLCSQHCIKAVHSIQDRLRVRCFSSPVIYAASISAFVICVAP